MFVDPDSQNTVLQPSVFVDPDAKQEPQAPQTKTGPFFRTPAQPTQTDNAITNYLGRVKEGVTGLFDPQTYRNVASDLAKPLPPIGKDFLSSPGGELTPEQKENLIGMVASVNPVTKMSSIARAAILPKNVTPLSEAALKAAELGLKVPRSNIKQTLWTNLIERAGGKEAIESTTRLGNQPTINKIVAKSLGLSDDTPLTKELLQGIREKAGESYKAVSKIGPLKVDVNYIKALRKVGEKYSGASKDFPDLASKEVNKLVKGLTRKSISSEGAVEMVKNLRNAGNANLRSLAPADKLLGRAQRAAAETLDDLIGRNLQSTGNSALHGAYQKSRSLIAKTYAVENALNPGTGNIVLSELAKQSRKGVPLGGGLKDLSTFAKGFPRLAREQTSAVPGGGLFEPLVYGTTGTIMAGPGGSAAALLPILGKPIARKFGSVVPRVPPPFVPPAPSVLEGLFEPGYRSLSSIYAARKRENK